MAVTGIAAATQTGPAATTATTATASPTASPTARPTGAVSPSADFNTFLKLLTTQLKNQDPMSPTDPTQFVAQLAQFSQVEQQAKTNTLLQQMTAAFSANSLTQSAALIGRTVQAEVSSVSVPASGNAAPLKVNVTQTALSQTRLVISDASGTELRSIPVGAGQSSVTFNGLGNNGVRLAAGTYAIKVVGNDSRGAPQAAGTVGAQGVVSQVVSRNGGGFSLALEDGTQVDAASVTTLAR